MLKKTLSAILAILAVSAVLTGCAATGGSGNPSGQTVTSAVTTDSATESVTEESQAETSAETEDPAIIGDGELISEQFEELDYVGAAETSSIKHTAEMIDMLSGTEHQNVIISPTSLDMAMGMLFAGANDNALDALSEYYNTTAENKADRDSKLIAAYNKYKNAEVLLSNAVYLNSDYSLTDTYADTVREKYKADVQSLDFKDAASADVINKFCADSTKDKITEIVKPETLLNKSSVILNALYFNAKWEDEFTKENVDENTDFTNGDGTISKVTGMSEHARMGYYETESAKAFAKSYKGYDFSFIGILPDESIIDENKNFKMSDIDIDALLTTGESKEVDIMLPKFKLEDMNGLNDCLKAQGLEEIFEANGYFKAMSPADFFVSDVLQKVVIEVDEKGTEAAAITAIMTMDAAAAPDPEEPKSVILNRPFIFMIYDNVNSEPLFIGKITKL